MALIRRFWADAWVQPAGGGFRVLLDGRPVRTPGRAVVEVPAEALAQAIAAEWADAPERTDPRRLPLTAIANAAIDRVAPDPAAVAGALAAYAEADLTCHRAEAPPSLRARQEAAWEPPLRWVESALGVAFVRGEGLMPVTQPAATLAAVRCHLEGLGPFRLAALDPLTRLSGSVVLALAVAGQALAPAAAFAAAQLDETYQAERWGEDAEAARWRADRQAAFLAAARFLELLA
ncbi:MAG: ATPase [Sphingomonadaceae bacterium]|uniref:ATP12 family protein n=1 Tax=Thermaurantiacus sp. TaxID=2820283 RepID=UPI00298EEADD|nr:ATP12 family protein [Thermaurantiacus sp.]MCS6987310.1 ATPase [Sphingomonadaceae bacterium]MDW8414530.1 ATP12 family protein [Thermaurantiacus sp.]